MIKYKFIKHSLYNFATINKSLKSKLKTEIKQLDFKEKLDLPQENIKPPKKEYENFAQVYYRYHLKKDFDLFDLRNLVYSYIFARQRNGKIMVNIIDSNFEVSNKLSLGN
jgi:hypothetical protein